MRLNSFDYFRTVAILIVVAGHSFSPQWELDTVPEVIFSNLVIGGTTLFVFISGFFFHYIFFKKYDFYTFLRKKAVNVFLPYVILSTMVIITYLFLGKTLSLQTAPVHLLDITQALKVWATYVATGKTMDAYWYIPFIMLMFLLSPFHFWYIKSLSSSRQLWLAGLLTLVSLFVHRPPFNLEVTAHLQSVVYYTPVYLLGILYSIHKEKIDEFLRGKVMLFACATFFVAFWQAAVVGSHGNYAKPFMQYGGVDLMLVQKLLMCLSILAFFNRYKHQEFPWLKKVANMSFAIYFIHPVMLVGVNIIRQKVDVGLPEGFVYLITVATVFAACMLIAQAIKKVLGDKSSYLIGW